MCDENQQNTTILTKESKQAMVGREPWLWSVVVWRAAGQEARCSWKRRVVSLCREMEEGKQKQTGVKGWIIVWRSCECCDRWLGSVFTVMVAVLPQADDDTPTREVKDVNTFFFFTVLIIIQHCKFQKMWSFLAACITLSFLLWVLLFPRTSIGLEYPTTVLRGTCDCLN